MANIKKETSIIWYKDDREISVDEKHDFKDGICTLLITEVGDYKYKMQHITSVPHVLPKYRD